MESGILHAKIFIPDHKNKFVNKFEVQTESPFCTTTNTKFPKNEIHPDPRHRARKMNAISPEVCKVKLEDAMDKYKKALAKLKEVGPPTSFLEVAACEEVLDGLKASLAEIEDLDAEGAFLDNKEAVAGLLVTTPDSVFAPIQFQCMSLIRSPGLDQRDHREVFRAAGGDQDMAEREESRGEERSRSVTVSAKL